jgi:pSer/pThr/pTyr-binding forkhead associated (FHA) protein
MCFSIFKLTVYCNNSAVNKKQLFLEITSGSDDAKIYSLEKSSYSIGSQPNADIYIQDHELSRKHLVLTIEMGICFISDLGSTNGTFLNDQRLEPGQKVEFPEFAHVRLGSRVLMSLSHENTRAGGPSTFTVNTDYNVEDRTRVISLSALDSARTADLVKKKEAVKKTRKVVKKKKKSYEWLSSALLFILIGGAFLSYQRFFKEVEVPLAADTVTPPSRKTVVSIPSKHVEQKKLISRSTLEEFFPQPKCATIEESVLCKFFQPSQDERFGVKQFDSFFLIFIDATTLIEEASHFLTGEHQGDDLKKLVSLMYFHREIKNEDFGQGLEDFDFIFLFYQQDPEAGHKLSFVAAVKPQFIKEMKNNIQDSKFLIVKRIGMNIFKFANDYLTIY